MTDWEVVIPGHAPALNKTYKVTYGGEGRRHVYKDSKVATWQDTAAWLVRAARPKDWHPSRRVMVTIEWYQPRKRDCDSGVKAALDAIATGLGVDDSIFLLCVPVNEIDKVNPRTVVRVSNESEA